MILKNTDNSQEAFSTHEQHQDLHMSLGPVNDPVNYQVSKNNKVNVQYKLERERKKNLNLIDARAISASMHR